MIVGGMSLKLGSIFTKNLNKSLSQSPSFVFTYDIVDINEKILFLFGQT